MTDDDEGLVANNIFINKNKLGTTLNFYKPWVDNISIGTNIL
jgi:hypothetical protein